MDSDDFPDALEDPYRVACPYGHTLLYWTEATETVYCRTCGAAYQPESVVDKRGSGNPGPGLGHWKRSQEYDRM